jgi:DNA-binding protein YbaB
MATPLPNPSTLLAGVLQLERNLATFEADRAALSFTAQSADGNVTAVASGLGRLTSLTIQASELALGPAALATKVKDVVNAALTQAANGSASAIASFAASLSLPGLPAQGSPVPNFADFALTADTLAATILANSPCASPRLFECRVGSILAVVNARRLVVTLTYDSLPDSASYLAARTLQAINCAVDTGTDRPGEDPTDPIVTSRGLQDLVLYAKGELKLNDRVKVRGVGCTNFGTIANAGNSETNLGVESETGNVLSRARVVIRDRGKAHGFVRTADVLIPHSQAVVDGAVEEQAVVVLPDLQLAVNFPTTSATIELEPSQTQTAAPGSYRKLVVKQNAQANLSAGVYYFLDLQLEPGGKVSIHASAGPVVIYVKNSLIFRGAFVDSAAGFPRVFVGYVGSATAVVESKYRGTLSAPYAKISISTIQSHEGAFHGRDIEVQPDTQICHRPFELRYEDLPGRAPASGTPPAVPDLGFEILTGWSSPQLTLSSGANPVSQGIRSLRIASAPGKVDILSVPFSADVAPNGATRMIVDLWVPSNQPNPTFFGTLSATISAPSAGVNGVSLGSLGLTGRAVNRFNQFEFPLPTAVRAALDGNATDVSLKLTLSANVGSGPWYIDNVRFLLAPPPLSSLDAILSFEDVTRWSSPHATLTSSTTFKQNGSRSLQLTTAPGFTQLVSAPFGSGPLNAPLGQFKVDLRIGANQPNPSWRGTLQLQVDVPSAGIFSAATAVAELTPLPLNAWSTITLALPTSVTTALNAEYGDIILKLLLNVPAGAGPYHFDFIRFV